jgi:hypothetical protein
MSISAPPPVLCFARVLAYAIVDESVVFTGKQQVYVDGKLLGRVPCLALCQNVAPDEDEIMLFHCDEQWNAVGVSGGETDLRLQRQMQKSLTVASQRSGSTFPSRRKRRAAGLSSNTLRTCAHSVAVFHLSSRRLSVDTSPESAVTACGNTLQCCRRISPTMSDKARSQRTALPAAAESPSR